MVSLSALLCAFAVFLIAFVVAWVTGKKEGTRSGLAIYECLLPREIHEVVWKGASRGCVVFLVRNGEGNCSLFIVLWVRTLNTLQLLGMRGVNSLSPMQGLLMQLKLELAEQIIMEPVLTTIFSTT